MIGDRRLSVIDQPSMIGGRSAYVDDPPSTSDENDLWSAADDCSAMIDDL